ncbi:MAG: hypothetical protein JSW14_06575 [Candidatus Bathyarchaeum sp.]|nr:MAG: hypothetical protein JSW14_06575 [Candidatus Bathyarchaeum sp.]
MTLKSRFDTKNPMVLLFSVFYIIVGIIEVGYWAIEIFAAPPHIGILGILSLITAYGFFRMKKWSVPLVIGLFFLGITFGAVTLNTSLVLQTFGGAPLFNTALIAYMIILLVAFIYTITKREDFN